MEYRNLGNTGLQVSLAGLGTNQFGGRLDAAGTAEVVNAALDLGVNFFDCADIYGGRGRSEEYLGRAMKGRRSEIVLATKAGNRMGDGPMRNGASRRYIMQAVEDSLRRLNTDYIDVYFIHVPDPWVPPDETMRALDDLVTAGKTRYIGLSNYEGWRLGDAAWTARHERLVAPAAAENQYSLLDRRTESEVIPSAIRYGMGFIPYAPLARGMLTGKYERGAAAPEGTRLATAPQAARLLVERNFDLVDQLNAYAQARGHTLVELALSWLACKSFVSTVIAGTTSVEQLQENVAATTAWRLTPEEMAEVNAIADPGLAPPFEAASGPPPPKPLL